MATQEMAKSQFVEASSKKVEVSSTVHEITVDEVTSTQTTFEPLVLDPRDICKLPPAPTVAPEFKPVEITGEFKCHYPSAKPSITRISKPLPFPQSLRELIAWTSAFVEEIDVQTVKREEKRIHDLQLLANEIKRLDTALATTEAALSKSHAETEFAYKSLDTKTAEFVTYKAKTETEITGLKATIEEQNCALEKARETEKRYLATIEQLKTEHSSQIATLNADHATAINILKSERDTKVKQLEADLSKEHGINEWLVNEMGELKGKNAADLEKQKQEYAAKLAKEHDLHVAELEKEHKEYVKQQKEALEQKRLHDEDHKALKAEHDLLNDTIKARDEALKELGETKEKLRKTQVSLDAKTKTAHDFECRLKNTHKKLDEEIQRLRTIRAEKAALEKVITGLKHDLTAEQKKSANAEKALKTANEAIVGLNKKLAEALKIEDTLHADIEKLKAEKKAALDQVAEFTHLVDENKKAIEVLNKEFSDAKQAAEKAKSDWEAERNQLQSDNKALKAGYDDATEELSRHQKADETKIAAAKASGMNPKELEKLKADAARVPQLEKDLENIKQRLIPRTPGSNVTVLTAEYGGKAYNTKEHAPLFNKLTEVANSGKKFHVDNDLFKSVGGDPWHHYKKSFSFTYLVDGDCVPRNLTGQEHADVAFDISPRK